MGPAAASLGQICFRARLRKRASYLVDIAQEGLGRDLLVEIRHERRSKLGLLKEQRGRVREDTACGVQVVSLGVLQVHILETTYPRAQSSALREPPDPVRWIPRFPGRTRP